MPYDRKSTRLNSSHGSISYAVFCLKKKKKRRDAEHTGNGYPATRSALRDSVDSPVTASHAQCGGCARFLPRLHHSFFFFFNDTATTEIYTLSLHDALPI